MSDEFDKEAEREKLRKKFAEDERKREHTQRLSELLLQGATMTNRHCETCGDPIFRHEGREFCPTCHATEDGYEVPVETPAAADDEGDTAESHATESAAAAESASTTADAGTGVTADVESPVPAAASEAARDGSATDEPAAPTSRVAESGPESAPPESDAGFAPPAPGAGARRTSADVDDVTAARDAIVETLTRFAQAAAETDDPRRARERLAAAKEAAETLAALDR
jgi:uncharacterized Zn finger protein (UPF0148 family)